MAVYVPVRLEFNRMSMVNYHQRNRPKLLRFFALPRELGLQMVLKEVFLQIREKEVEDLSFQFSCLRWLTEATDSLNHSEVVTGMLREARFVLLQAE